MKFLLTLVLGFFHKAAHLAVDLVIQNLRDNKPQHLADLAKSGQPAEVFLTNLVIAYLANNVHTAPFAEMIRPALASFLEDQVKGNGVTEAGKLYDLLVAFLIREEKYA